ncbi:MAG: hypothetical protein Q8O87_02815 [bacterium]|nr:hypothetical protein [bacterium]
MKTITIAILITIFFVSYAAISTDVARAEQGGKCQGGGETLCIFGRDIDCVAASSGGARTCNLADLVFLIKVVIEFMQIIIIPIAVAFIVYGGIVIMTAGGSGDKVTQGRKIITAAIIGVAISLGAYLLVTALNFLTSGPIFK